MRNLLGKPGASLPQAETLQVRKEDMHGTEKTQPVLFAIKVSNPALEKTAPHSHHNKNKYQKRIE